VAEVELKGVSRRFGTAQAAVDGIDLRVAEGRLVSLLGPSGCGKTTTLRMIAGLERPDDGVITIGGTVVASAKDRINLPSERRHLGMVFQSYALWPHMTIAKNIAYPLRMVSRRKRMPSAQIKERVDEVLDLVGMAGMGNRTPAELSGGQQQRIAVARALAAKPSVLLMDEPFSNLDARLRDRMVAELRDLHDQIGITTIYVTHDQREAAVLSDEVVVMELGRIIEHNSPQEVFLKPNSVTTAVFLGYNTELDGTVIDVQGDVVSVAGNGWSGSGRSATALQKGEAARVVVRPGDVELTRSADDTADVWVGTVERSHFVGVYQRLSIRVQAAVVLVDVPPGGATDIHVGDTVRLRTPHAGLWFLAGAAS
jgi:iron(III) transport system ATP-binding protein